MNGRTGFPPAPGTEDTVVPPAHAGTAFSTPPMTLGQTRPLTFLRAQPCSTLATPTPTSAHGFHGLEYLSPPRTLFTLQDSTCS